MKAFKRFFQRFSLSTWSIRAKLWALSGAMIANMLVVGILATVNLRLITKQIDTLANVQLPAAVKMMQISLAREGGNATVYRAFMASQRKDASAAAELQGRLQELNQSVNVFTSELRQLPLSPAIKQEIQDVRPKIDSYVKKSEELAELIVSGKPSEASGKLPEYESSADELKLLLENLEGSIRTSAAESKMIGERLAKRSNLLNLLFIGLGFLVGTVFSYLLIRPLVDGLTRLISRLSSEADQVRGSSDQIQVSSQELSESTTEQAAGIQETVASMDEMASMLRNTNDSAQKTLHLSEAGTKSAEDARGVISRMNSAMDDIQSSNEKLQGLVKVIQQIQAKTKIINDIVFETRLLSFNASIEAARAGVHGKGFAVVAEEVGKLASTSGKAAEEIRELLESSTREVASVVSMTQERVGVGKSVSLDCEQAFNTMGKSLQEIGEAVKVIASASREQEAGVRQTNQAMNEMEQITNRNSRGSENLASLADLLAGGAKSLNEAVSTMSHLVLGAGKSAPKPGDGPKADAQPKAPFAAVKHDELKAAPAASGDSKPQAVAHGKQKHESRWKAA